MKHFKHFIVHCIVQWFVRSIIRSDRIIFISLYICSLQVKLFQALSERQTLDRVFFFVLDRQSPKIFCFFNSEVLFPKSMTTLIVSDERSCRTSLRRKSSSTTGSINSLFRHHFFVLGISTSESYSQRFFHFEFDIFRNLPAFRVAPAMFVLPGYKVARFPS